tara:strand:- start:26 stop:289 length:264 start_codon:yes stop_codon:yes gene_type:complete
MVLLRTASIIENSNLIITNNCSMAPLAAGMEKNLSCFKRRTLLVLGKGIRKCFLVSIDEIISSKKITQLARRYGKSFKFIKSIKNKN